jgi:hypothetical protein
LDRGRLFFPNTYREFHGGDKPRAFRGIRPEILDLLALSHELAKSIDYITGADRYLRRCAFVLLKREFVSAIQDATSFSAPATVRKYEIYLTKISVEPLPEQIRVLAGATKMGFQIKFNASIELDTGRPGRTKLIPKEAAGADAAQQRHAPDRESA